MGFQVSPGVNVSEIDLTTVVPAVSTTEGAIAGVFNWGPVEQRVLVDSETTLVSRFGKPTSDNAETFFTAANFLAYGNKLYVVRTVSSGAKNSTGVANTSGTTGVLIKNQDIFEEGGLSFDANIKVAAKYAGTDGDSLRVEICDSANAYSQNIDPAWGGGSSNNASLNPADSATHLAMSVGSNTAVLKLTAVDSSISNSALSTLADAVVADIQVGDLVVVGNSSIGEQNLEISSIAASGSDTFTDEGSSVFSVKRNISLKNRFTLSSDINMGTIKRRWKYFESFDAAPGTTDYVSDRSGVGDELHVIVVDEDGVISGVPETILESWPSMSRATDAKTESGDSNYYYDKINQSSSWIYFANHPAGSYATTASASAALSTALPYRYSFLGGNNGNNEGAISLADLAVGYDMFADSADVDVSLVMQGRSVGGSVGEGLFNYIIDNVTEKRKDCVAFGSPAKADVVGVTSASDAADNIVEYRNAARSSSYAVLDSGYKYQYDKYNDVYRYIPLNGDVAGLVARTDDERDAWFSPGGFNRGQIKNVVKLAYNPRQAFRDVLYKAGVNPVVSFPGQGNVLYGDKTLLAKPSAFDRINVRRLFIVLEKAISTAAKFTLFEFNDEFTRAQFVNLVEPFLRDVQGRRGIFDFRVVCDESNNTGEVIDRNEFIGDIYVKPARSINFIQLNFVAVRTGVEFSEVVGKF